MDSLTEPESVSETIPTSIPNNPIIDDNDITYVIGFWRVNNNVKHDMSHYYKIMPKTFNRLKKKKIVFFYGDDNILKYVNKIRKTQDFIAIKIPVKELPTYELSADYLESCKNQDIDYLISKNDEKGLNHYRREYKKSGEEAYRKIISIWTSKLLLIKKVIDSNPFDSKFFVWADAAIGKTKLKIRKTDYNMNFINTNRSYMIYMGERIKNGAGFMISSYDTWLKLIPLYEKKLEELRHSNYAHDEETILHLICKENEELFNNI
jgi:hypothetical protein